MKGNENAAALTARLELRQTSVREIAPDCRQGKAAQADKFVRRQESETFQRFLLVIDSIRVFFVQRAVRIASHLRFRSQQQRGVSKSRERQLVDALLYSIVAVRRGRLYGNTLGADWEFRRAAR